MLTRLMGLETEYAIRYSPTQTSARRLNRRVLYDAIAEAIRELVPCQNGTSFSSHEQFFTHNGGAFSFEQFPHNPREGLLEGATPECNSPTQLLLYQKAQEQLLLKALPRAAEYLAVMGHHGELGLLKNGRDVDGYVYGAQENYEVEVASGWHLWAYRAGLIVTFPWLAILFLWQISLLLHFLVFFLPIVAIGSIYIGIYEGITSPDDDDDDDDIDIPPFDREKLTTLLTEYPNLSSHTHHTTPQLQLVDDEYDDEYDDEHDDEYDDEYEPGDDVCLYPLTLLPQSDDEPTLPEIDPGWHNHDEDKGESLIEQALMKLLHWGFMPFHYGQVIPTVCLAQLFLYRRLRRGATGFFISRFVYSGCGYLERDGHFVLSEKGPLMKHGIWAAFESKRRGIIDIGNLLKAQQSFFADWRTFASVFRQRQRMQLGFSDSNVLDVAEFLKFGATALVLDMAEAGMLDDAPQPKRRRKAILAMIQDPSLTASIETKSGNNYTAIALQRFYLERAKQYIKQHPTPSLEAKEIVELWAQVLDGIEGQTERWVGQLDWVTKRFLLETSGKDEPWATKKKIDLRYHELGEGYAAALKDAGWTKRLVTDDEIKHAIEHPPEDTPASLRGHLIKEAFDNGTTLTVSWSKAKLHEEAEVISLADFQRHKRD